MSFLGGAECSTGHNPLSQFTKRFTEDRSLQRDRLADGRAAVGGMRSMGGDIGAEKQVRFRSTLHLVIIDGNPPNNNNNNNEDNNGANELGKNMC